ncbi:hypothetical protein ACVWXL_005184 [Bradyrhizobium sp. GM22.5]
MGDVMAGVLVVQLRTLNANRQKGESKPKRPLWKHFDDTHHWDSTAEEWVPDKISDRATHYASRRPSSETPSLSLVGLSSGAVAHK